MVEEIIRMVEEIIRKDQDIIRKVEEIIWMVEEIIRMVEAIIWWVEEIIRKVEALIRMVEELIQRSRSFPWGPLSWFVRVHPGTERDAAHAVARGFQEPSRPFKPLGQLASGHLLVHPRSQFITPAPHPRKPQPNNP